MSDVIKTSTSEKGVLHITLNRPNQRNALSHELLSMLEAAIQSAKNNGSIKGVLISGEGKAFCAGADISELEPLSATDGLAFAEYGQSVFNQIETLGKPVVVAIHGFAFGGGCELAMSGTIRIASENTVFGQPEVKLGVIPGFGGTQRLSRLIGKGRALECCLTGRKISTEEALQWGLVNEVVSQEELVTYSLDLLNTLVAMPGIALRSMIAVINDGYDMTLADAQSMEAAYFGVCCSTKDKVEGVDAFLNKREAIFEGE